MLRFWRRPRFRKRFDCINLRRSNSVVRVSALEDRDSALETLIARLGDRLYTIGYRMCGNRADAEDILQETYLSAWKGWGSFRGEADPATWLYSIANRHCLRKRRRRSGEPKRHLAIEDVLPVPGRSEDPLGRLERRSVRRSVRRAIASLPPLYRAPVVLKDVVGLKIGEIARILSVSPETAKMRLHRGRLALRKALLGEEPAGDLRPPKECLAYLESALDALDRPAGKPPAHACRRCRSVFESLRIAREACAALSGERLSEAARERIRRRIRSGKKSAVSE
jgi:RNA polymerase sigma-70 factor (ECF subfamily)